MKNFFLVLLSCSFFFACSRKTVPPKGNNATIVNGNSATADNNSNNINNNTNSNVPAASADTTTVKNVNALSFMIVSDAYGKIVTPQDSLPANANVQFNQFELSKGFTAQQLINLKTRYQTIPPRVLYVSAEKQTSSPRGTYYVLAKKFWYWKKKDGLFYLDDKYYL